MDFETLKRHRAFKKDILDVIFTHCETLYLHCLPSDDLIIGNRGLIEKEEEDGIMLVFGPQSNRNLTWDEDLIYCELQFKRWENVQIPYECISRVFDKEGAVIMQWATFNKDDFSDPKSEEKEKCNQSKSVTSKIIQIDFKKKRK